MKKAIKKMGALGKGGRGNQTGKSALCGQRGLQLAAAGIIPSGAPLGVPGSHPGPAAGVEASRAGPGSAAAVPGPTPQACLSLLCLHSPTMPESTAARVLPLPASLRSRTRWKWVAPCLVMGNWGTGKTGAMGGGGRWCSAGPC